MNAQTIDDMLASKGVTATVTTYPDAEFDPATNTTVSYTHLTLPTSDLV